mgnify:FL=1
MNYIKLTNGIPENYTIEQLLEEFPNAIIYKKTKMPNEDLLKQYNVFPLVTEAQPQHEEDETVEEGTPMFKNMEWHQTWNVRKLTQEEVQEIVDINVLESISHGDVSLFASTELQNSRTAICEACDSFTEFKTCRESNAMISLKIKLEEEVCPLDKW